MGLLNEVEDLEVRKHRGSLGRKLTFCIDKIFNIDEIWSN